MFERWEDLVVAHQCRGKPADDARIAAAMLGCGVRHLLTFNGRDLQRFPAVAVVDPAHPVVA